MKRRTNLVLIGIGVAAALLFAGFSAGAEKGERLTDPVRPVQTERDLGSDRSPAVGPHDRGADNGLDDVLQLEARRETPPPEREAEALRFHQNSLLERFENADAHGQLVLSFSADGIDLGLRSVTGADAPIVSMRRSPNE